MILTVTPNPALDVTYLVDSIEPGAEHRVLDVQERPGGKGINVARILAALGEKAATTGLVFGEAGEQVRTGLDRIGVPQSLVRRDRAGAGTRRTVVIVEPSGRATSFSEPGPTVATEDVEALLASVGAVVREASVVVVSGSLPPGMPDEDVARLTACAAGAGVPVLVDTSGPALVHAARAGAVVKPNLTELCSALSVSPLRADDLASVAALADRLTGQGSPAVVVTLGGAGALAVCGRRAWRVRAVALPPGRARNPTGAGDAFAAALARGLTSGGVADLDWPRVLADAGALAAAAVLTPVAGEVDEDAYRSWTGEVVVEEWRR